MKLENDWTVKEDNLIVYLPLKQILYFDENEKRIYKSEELEHALCIPFISPLYKKAYHLIKTIGLPTRYHSFRLSL